jgi:CheY-like chemotaxis protein
MSSTLNKPVLLIAEDDDRLRYLVVAAAERSGAYSAVHDVADGQAALEDARAMLSGHGDQHAPLVVLSDLNMPRMDGIQLIHELKHHAGTRDIPIVIMTSSSDPNDREHALNAGCVAFYPKPQRFEDLMALLVSLPSICDAQAHAAAELAARPV